jgi:hypothetical protein
MICPKPPGSRCLRKPLLLAFIGLEGRVARGGGQSIVAITSR